MYNDALFAISLRKGHSTVKVSELDTPVGPRPTWRSDAVQFEKEDIGKWF